MTTVPPTSPIRRAFKVAWLTSVMRVRTALFVCHCSSRCELALLAIVTALSFWTDSDSLVTLKCVPLTPTHISVARASRHDQLHSRQYSADNTYPKGNVHYVCPMASH